jgi:hypothetical protein
MLSTSQVVDAVDVDVYLNAIRTVQPVKAEMFMLPEGVQINEAVFVSKVPLKFDQVAALGSPLV